MLYHRTGNFDLVDRIFRQPEIYEFSGDDTLPEPDEFKVNRDPAIWYVLAGNADLVGIFSLLPQNAICWEVHTAMMSWASTAEKWAAARGFVPWLWSHTPCRRLTAAVPSFNRAARMYAIHGLGLHCVGRQHDAFLKNGRLHDLVLFGRSREEGSPQHA